MWQSGANAANHVEAATKHGNSIAAKSMVPPLALWQLQLNVLTINLRLTLSPRVTRSSVQLSTNMVIGVRWVTTPSYFFMFTWSSLWYKLFPTWHRTLGRLFIKILKEAKFFTYLLWGSMYLLYSCQSDDHFLGFFYFFYSWLSLFSNPCATALLAF